MTFQETSIHGAYLIRLDPHVDDRGSFSRAWCAQEFAGAGLAFHPVQLNVATSQVRGTLRGLHYQVAPFEEAKLMRCVQGAIFDVLADVRAESETYGRWFGVELTADAQRMLYVPEGVAHGYMTLVDHVQVSYLASGGYEPQAERGVRWDDPFFGIDWPQVGPLVISDKDRSWGNFDSRAGADGQP